MQTETTAGSKPPHKPIKAFGTARPSFGPLHLIRRLVSAVAATGLALLMFLIAVDVIGRYFFNYPVPGGYELTEYLMAIFVPLSIAICADHRTHVGVDMVVEKFSSKTQAKVDAVTLLITVALAAIMAWQCCVAVPESYTSGLKTAVLQIPVFPSVLFVAIGVLALTLFIFVHFLDTLKKVFKK
jgi:TRAP-type C4-dicarboxylate transport system permease small subunit